MKVDKLKLDDADKMEVVAQKPVKTEKFIQSIKPHKGHILFEINPITGKCKVAEYERLDIMFTDKNVHKKVIATYGCVYISALNKKNALIKFFKMVGKQIEQMKRI